MDAGGGTGWIPFPFLQEAKKIKIWDRTQKHYLPYEGEKDSSSCSPSKEKEKKKYEHIEHGRGM